MQEHVSNKSAYLCGVMKTYRQKSRAGAAATNGAAGGVGPQQAGPDEEKIRAILERTGYSLDVTTGQRKYGGPPPGWEGPAPGNGCEVSISQWEEQQDLQTLSRKSETKKLVGWLVLFKCQTM